MDGVNFFRFGGENSKDHGVYIKSKKVYSTSARVIETTVIPGKNGALYMDQGYFENVPVEYACFADPPPGFTLSQTAADVKGWLFGNLGYCRLEDSYDKDYFRYGYLSGGLDVEDIVDKLGEMTISFSCKPFRYRKSGEKSLVLTSSNTLYNPERFPSKPYIKIVGNGEGTLTVGSQTLTLKEIDEYLEIDCEMMNCFKGTELRNSMVSGDRFPELLPGKTGISWSGNISRVEIKPRWCTL